jgi:hypothetical protein
MSEVSDKALSSLSEKLQQQQIIDDLIIFEKF